VKLKIVRGGFFDGPVLVTEDGQILPGQISVDVHHCLKKSTVLVEFVIDKEHVRLALDEKVDGPSWKIPEKTYNLIESPGATSDAGG